MKPLALFFALFLTPSFIFSAPISRQEHSLVLAIGYALGVPTSVTDRLQIEESGEPSTGGWGHAAQIGKDGSRGLFQLSPVWQGYLVGLYYPHSARYFDVFNPIDNAVVALGYLADLHKRLGSWERALWYYNCGYVTDVPQKTRNYAERIINWVIPREDIKL